jgi:signal transduction histidine kinase
MAAIQLTILTLAIESLVYLLLGLVAVRRGAGRERAGRDLILYLAASGLWVLMQLAWMAGWLAALRPNPYIMARLSLYGLVVLASLLLRLTQVGLQRPGSPRGWTALALAWMAGLVLLDGILISPSGESSLGGVTFAGAMVGWGVMMATTLVLVLRAYHRARVPMHRLRYTYWLLAWAITVTGDLLFLAEREVIGGDIRLLGAAVLAFIVLTHHLPDVRQVLWRATSYLIVTLLTVVIYTVGFAGAQVLLWEMPGYRVVWAGALVALILAILFAPLLQQVQRFTNRLFGGLGHDPGHLVSEYSMRISNIVSLERLAVVTVDLICNAFGAERGALFVVEHERGEDGAGFYHLRPVTGEKAAAPTTGALSDKSPLTHRLRELRSPLTQYDVDLLPEFEQLAAAERDWLSGQDMDVVVPIHAKASWIGLLALGPKTSGQRYFDHELALLSTLADQTAVALENARLVDDLIEINYDLEQAYTTLERANRQLQEMDRLKSAFIGTITHELRSPLANIDFSLQLFNRDGLSGLTAEQREQLQQVTTSARQALELVNNLIAFATFLSKQGELHLEDVDLGQLVRETLSPLRPLIQAKKLGLRMAMPDELPALRGDRERLSDATYHLIHNAVKFTPSGGEIWIRCQAQGQELLFEVRDTGIGVPADRLPTLWEGFSQMADPLRRGVEGLGLGLPLVRYIATAHGGRVWCESHERVGSIFGFLVPLAGPSLRRHQEGQPGNAIQELEQETGPASPDHNDAGYVRT